MPAIFAVGMFSLQDFGITVRRGARRPVLALFGDADVSIPAGTIEEFRELLRKNGNVSEIKVYPDSGHAFFRDSDPQAYRPAASQDAWIRAKAFFASNLK